MAHAFASQKWTDELWAQLRSDETVRSEGATWAHGPLLLVIEADASAGFPSDVALRLDFHEGEARDLRLVDAGESVRLTPFAIAGGFPRWKALLSAGRAAGLVDGILQSTFRSRGDLPTLTRHSTLLDAIVACGGRVATSWQDEQEAPEAAATPAGAAN